MQLFHLSFSGFAGDRWAEVCVSRVELCVIGEERREGGGAESESQNTVYEYVCVKSRPSWQMKHALRAIFHVNTGLQHI